MQHRAAATKRLWWILGWSRVWIWHLSTVWLLQPAREQRYVLSGIKTCVVLSAFCLSSLLSLHPSVHSFSLLPTSLWILLSLTHFPFFIHPSIRPSVCSYHPPSTSTPTCNFLLSSPPPAPPVPSHLSLFSPYTEEWATKVALLKRNCFAAVFEEYFDLQQKGGQQATAIIHYRDQETMWVGLRIVRS